MYFFQVQKERAVHTLLNPEPLETSEKYGDIQSNCGRWLVLAKENLNFIPLKE
jgi:hypothetical protein